MTQPDALELARAAFREVCEHALHDDFDWIFKWADAVNAKAANADWLPMVAVTNEPNGAHGLQIWNHQREESQTFAASEIEAAEARNLARVESSRVRKATLTADKLVEALRTVLDLPADAVLREMILVDRQAVAVLQSSEFEPVGPGRQVPLVETKRLENCPNCGRDTGLKFTAFAGAGKTRAFFVCQSCRHEWGLSGVMDAAEFVEASR